jgi:hypothetical protein
MITDLLIMGGKTSSENGPLEESTSKLDKKETARSDSSIDEEVFEKEKKEFYECDYNLETSLWLYGILIFTVLVFLAPSIYIFIEDKIFATELNYIWVCVYFTA